MIKCFLSSIYLLVASLTACAQPQGYDTASVSVDGVVPVVMYKLPEKLSFAGEGVPLENYDTRESLMKELQINAYLHSRTMQTLIATKRYFPVIEPIMKKYGIPEDFKYLCVAESGLDPNAGSSAGAAGLWQLMPPFAKSVGLYIGGGVDERYHVEKSTEAACKYLADAKAKFGNWTLAAASYNLGLSGLDRRIKKQGVDNYYDIFLPNETMRYVFRILALKQICLSPDAYGFMLSEQDYMKPLTEYKEITVNGANIDWPAVALKNGTTYKMLRELNHWIRDYDYTSKTSRTFTVRIPSDDFRK